METDPQRKDFTGESGFHGFKRLDAALAELNGGWSGRHGITPKQREEMLFWAILQTDPLIEAHDKIPQEVRDALSPAPPMDKAVLESLMVKLERVARLYVLNPEEVIRALQKVY